MNIHEALMTLGGDKLAACSYTYPHEQLINALDMAMEALKKQQPKKPVKRGETLFNCPNCSRRYMGVFMNPRFCSECGQALDWG